MTQILKTAFIALSLVFLSNSAFAAEKSDPTEPIAFTPMALATGCSASCQSSVAGRGPLTCSASGAGASCSQPLTSQALCTEGNPVTSTTACNCSGGNATIGGIAVPANSCKSNP